MLTLNKLGIFRCGERFHRNNCLIGNESALSALQIIPTKLELFKAMKICDIFNPSSQGIESDFIE